MPTVLQSIVSRLRNEVGLGGSTCSETLGAAFPNLHYIWLTRRDKLRQAISLTVAGQTGAWVDVGITTPLATPRYDFSQIDKNFQYVQGLDRAWATFFLQEDVRPIAVSYEELVASGQTTICAMLNSMGIATPSELGIDGIQLRNQSVNAVDKWVQEYHRQYALGWTPL
jgi:LPS sulfotransferase NodH